MAENRSEQNSSQRKLSRWHRWHRWLGVGSIVFVLVLSTTGIALNHSDDLSLDSRYIRSPWLLEWYGIDVPVPDSSFVAAPHRVTLIGERLYYDDSELMSGISTLIGVVSTPSFVAIATSADLLLVTPGGALVERVDTQSFLPAGVTGIGIAGETLVLSSGDELYQTDENLLAFSPCRALDVGEIHWSVPSAISPAELTVLQQLYRGRGLSLERLLLDLHSGKILARIGPILMDVVGVTLIMLSLLGLSMWFRKNGKNGNSSNRS